MQLPRFTVDQADFEIDLYSICNVNIVAMYVNRVVKRY